MSFGLKEASISYPTAFENLAEIVVEHLHGPPPPPPPEQPDPDEKEKNNGVPAALWEVAAKSRGEESHQR